MSKITKKRKEAMEQYDFDKAYSLAEGVKIVKESSKVNFDASVDIHVCLGINPKKPDQLVRGVQVLPHGTGKEKRILVLCTPEKEEAAKQAGADYAGSDEYIKKLKSKWKEIDVIIAVPSLMAKIGKEIGKIIGPMGLMPNPKNGTVTTDVVQAVKEIKAGKIELKADAYGHIHASVGRVSFSPVHLEENIRETIETLVKLKPSAAKGTYLKNITIASTMGKGVMVDKAQF